MRQTKLPTLSLLPTLLLAAAASASASPAALPQIVFPGSTGARTGHHDGPEAGAGGGSRCVRIGDCPALSALLRSNPEALGEFDECGFEDGEPLFRCPRQRQEEDGNNR